MKRLIKPLVTAAVAATLFAVSGPSQATADSDAEPVAGYNLMGPPPPGANDWNCRPSVEHPRPVVLVHGTGSNMQDAFKFISPMLKDQGYCVFALNYGGIRTWFDPNVIAWGVADIQQSAGQLAAFVDAVLAHTGAAQVDLVGHSQGGMMPRQYLKYNSGADIHDPTKNKVNTLVALGPTNHGTTFNGQQQMYSWLATAGLLPTQQTRDYAEWVLFGVAGRQQLVGSGLISQLNTGGETLPGVRYVVIASQNDETITPPQSSFLSMSGGNATNLWIQDGCPANVVSHAGLISDPRSLWLITTSLDPAYQSTHPEPCKR